MRQDKIALTCNVVLLPCEHDLRSPVIPRGHVASHLGILKTREPEITDLGIRKGKEVTKQDVRGVDVRVFLTPTLRSQFSFTKMLEGLRSL